VQRGWTAAYVVRNHRKVRKIAKGDEASKGDRPLTQHLQWDHALVSGPMLHDQEYGKEHHSNCEQEDDSPIDPGVCRSRPLQAQYQAQSHRYVYGEAWPVDALQPILAAEVCILGSTNMTNAKEDYYNNSNANRDNNIEAEPPCRVMGYASTDEGTQGQSDTFYATVDCRIDRPVLE
jgi:hypothetical protein